jgi:DNA repair protein RadC
MAEIPERDRPRERLIKRGAKALRTRELIAVIIGRGTRGRDVLAVSDELERVLGERREDATIEDLTAVPGVGEAKACQLLAAFEIARRFRDRTRACGSRVPRRCSCCPTSRRSGTGSRSTSSRSR